MSSLNWDPAWETGIRSIDQQHQRLLDQTARLEDEVLGGRTEVDVRTSLEFLAHHTFSHFQDEERIMQEAGYPELAAHRLSHLELREALDVLLRQQTADASSLTAGVVRYMHAFVTQHVAVQDLALANFLRERGLDPV